ncbi:MAG: extracellular solute-binding protein [Anaerolineae bacterium]|nr:extracellular solute-binding protein [Anaerolineae bacterium]
MRKLYRYGLWLLFLCAVSLTFVSVSAQEAVTLKVAVPSFFKDLIADELVESYEAAHPGIKVEVVGATTSLFYNVNLGVDSYLDSVESYVSEADVVAITTNELATEATRAGYFLDMSPLISTDPDFDESDFYPVMLNSFRWDNGTWALPVSADVITMMYNKEAFDAAGEFYPDGAWTLADLEAAIRALSEYDEDGNITASALLNLSSGPYEILHSLAGGISLADESVQPSIPDLDKPELEPLLTAWSEMQAEGLLTPPDISSLDLDVPMMIGQSLLAISQQVNGDWQITTLPGGRAGLLVNGVAVSAGTQHPEAAYELAKFITTNAELANSFLGVSPARRSLVGVDTEGGILGTLLSVPDEMRPMIEEALNNAISGSDARFARFIDLALQKMMVDGLDAQTALQETEQEVIQRLEDADAQRDTAVVQVATPRPPAELSTGEVSITFGISSLFPQLPNRDRWDQVVEDFVNSDPEVGEVTLEVKLPFPSLSLASMAETYDCFYIDNNLVPGADLSQIRSMDPLMASDFNFDPNDIAGNALNLVRRDNQIWAMPLNIQPLVLWYDPDIFQQYGAREPFEGWTVSDFEDALRTLKVDNEDPIPFVSRNLDSSHLMSLIVAYGGLPLDYRTDPVAINFTDPATVDAIRQVLDLAKDGYIEYNPLVGGGTNFSFGRPEGVAMYSQLLNSLSFVGIDSDTENPYRLSTFPQGTQYSALSFDLGTGYISAFTPAIEPCYRFITAVADTPDLFENLMPVRRSQINSPDLVTAQGQEAADFYREMDRLMQQPNTVIIPSTFQAATDLTSIGDAVLALWLNRAFDRYVLEDADLEVELEEAQLYASSYQGCAANVPPATEEDNILTYVQKYVDCAVQIDPSMSDQFPQLTQ